MFGVLQINFCLYTQLNNAHTALVFSVSYTYACVEYMEGLFAKALVCNMERGELLLQFTELYYQFYHLTHATLLKTCSLFFLSHNLPSNKKVFFFENL